MKCPECGGVCEVIDTRETTYGKRRRVQCKCCHHRFRTVEITADEYEYLVGLSNNYKQAYEFTKKVEELLKGGVENA